MDNSKETNLFNLLFSKKGHFIMPIFIFGLLLIMLLPLPTFMLDILITVNLSISISVLLVTMYILNPIEFSSFPSIMLVVTLFRLSLNIASTKLILLHGEYGSTAAGRVIETFGQHVAGGNFIVGIVIFAVIVIIQFIVVSKGAVRISEVTARFTLDALPGKQMAIDADLNAGIISEQDARTRRESIQKEADFYGKMDGASRFSEKDAIASIIITFINIIGGLLIGVLQKDMDIGTAAQVYVILTIGDGLVSAIPSLLISVSAGMIATRSASKADLGEDILKQIQADPRPILIISGILGVLGFTPGMPNASFLFMSMVFGTLGYFALKEKKKEVKKEIKESMAKPDKPARETKESLQSLLKVDPLNLELGYRLIQLVDAKIKGNLLDRIKSIRRQIALDMGIIVPPVRIRDNLQLENQSYSILLKGSEVARGTVLIGKLLAMNPGYVKEEISGTKTIEPAFGLPAIWIDEKLKDKAQFAGYTVVDPITVIATHLTEIIRKFSSELLGRQDLAQMIDTLSETHSKLVDELVPNILDLGTILKVIKNLLFEGVSVRDMVTIFETLADFGKFLKDSDLLTEYVRQALSRAIVKPYVNNKQELAVLTLSPKIEGVFSQSIQTTEMGSYLNIDPETAREILMKSQNVIEKTPLNTQPIFLVNPNIRRFVKNLFSKYIENIVVLSHNEIPQKIRVIAIGVVE